MENQIKVKETARKLTANPKLILITLVLVLLFSFAVYYFAGSSNDDNSFQKCTEQNPSSVVISGSQLTCSAGGQVFTAENPAQSQIYQDDKLVFRYPRGWTIERQQTEDSKIYALSIRSNDVSGNLPSNGADTSFALNGSIIIRPKESVVPDCRQCIAKESRLTVFKDPVGPYRIVFGNSSAIYGNPLVMSINSKEIKAGVKNYESFIKLPDSTLLTIRGSITYQFEGQAIYINSVFDFIRTPVFKDFELLLNSIEIK